MTGPIGGDLAAREFDRSPHLVALVAESERLAAALAACDPPAATTAAALEEAALASLRLDGSSATAPHGHDLPTDRAGGDHPGGWSRSSWLDALRDGEGGEEQLTAVELDGVRQALTADDLSAALVADAASALSELHRRLTVGLLADGLAGRPRRSRQAVSDASVGRVLYFTTEPDRVPSRLAVLSSWLASAAAREHALVVSGIAHLELLITHPFEAANGRLARTAARLLLRARGLDPHRLAQVEPVIADDPMGYHEEVARTLRRRDATVWLERWGETVAAGLRRSARALGLLPTGLPTRPAAFLAGWDEPGFTLADYRAVAGVEGEQARGDLDRLLDAGRVQRVPGSRGLRFRILTG